MLDERLITRAKSQPFDPKHAADAFGLDVEDVLDIIEDYFHSVKRDLSSLNKSIKSNDISGISAVSHKIKGSSANLRMNFISNIARDMENAAKANKDFDYMKNYLTIKELLTITESQFKERQ